MMTNADILLSEKKKKVMKWVLINYNTESVLFSEIKLCMS